MKKKIIELIQKEILWSKQDQGLSDNPDYKQGYIKGLQQAIYLITIVWDKLVSE